MPLTVHADYDMIHARIYRCYYYCYYYSYYYIDWLNDDIGIYTWTETTFNDVICEEFGGW